MEEKQKKHRILNKIWIYLKPFASWRFLVSYSVPFFLVNGWAWAGSIALTLGVVNWFTTTAATWLAILWLPATPEKLITIPAAIWIHTKLFKKDPKTRVSLNRMHLEAKSDWAKTKAWIAAKFNKKK